MSHQQFNLVRVIAVVLASEFNTELVEEHRIVTVKCQTAEILRVMLQWLSAVVLNYSQSHCLLPGEKVWI